MAGITKETLSGHVGPDRSANLTGCRADDQTMDSRGGCERALKFRDKWEGSSGKCCCCQPDSGNPTVRDERGAYGNVGDGGTMNPLHKPKVCMTETLCLSAPVRKYGDVPRLSRRLDRKA